MFCINCGTQFDGANCPNCGHPASKYASSGSARHIYYDNDGDEIDLAVVRGVYRNKTAVKNFFRNLTTYSPEEINNIVNYMFSSVPPKPYSILEAGRMQRQIEAGLPISKKSLPPLFRIVALCISIFLFVMIIWLLWTSFSPFSSNIKDDGLVTLSEYNSIQNGMTYSEVIDIFGSDGENLSSVTIGDEQYHTEIYSWDGNGSLGANCNITFQGGKVVAKAQIGLE
ncbi:DUF3862 domain-containing protein [Agathobaculum faecis]|jgi:hypothetical protein|nr:DUF3862 domain-containing protein [Agathobaculum faecis]